ncbi:hypothetical protein AAKU55_003781 [Oxalobacteraceae bacterium GrIS 1.11]
MQQSIETFDEKAMQQLEARVPEFADVALKEAYAKALRSGSKVLEALDGKLFESSPDGSQRLIKLLPPPVWVALGSKRFHRVAR